MFGVYGETMRRNLVIAISFLLLAMSQFARGQEKKTLEDTPNVAYCDLIREPTAYDQKIVRVKVTYIVGFEASIMYDLTCGGKNTWVRFEPVSETATNRSVQKKFQRLTDATPERTSDGGINFPYRRVEVVWLGRFEGVKPAQKIGEQTFSLGFGHLNGFDYQFNVQRIEEVKAIPRNTPWQ
jgi:hypothetical protein